MHFTINTIPNHIGARADHIAVNEQARRLLGHGNTMNSIAEICKFVVIRNKEMTLDRQSIIAKILEFDKPKKDD